VLNWTQWYLAANIFIGLLAFTLISNKKGWPSFSWNKIRKSFGEGFFFSFGIASKSIYTDCDKILLARLSFLTAAGHYAAAYSVISFAFTPIQALLAASYPLFFRAGAQGGINESLALSRKLLPLPILYGIVAAAALYLGAPLLPFILGEKFSGAVEIIRWLAIVPCIQAVHYLLADALTGAGLQRLRSAGQAVTAGLNIGLNLYLIPLYTWKGAAIATLISEACLVIFLFAAIAKVKMAQQIHTTPRATP
jgi:O-antigen/teichoic acid export membrane protein